jgi:RND family efflux transporter MFP subunit
VRTQVLERQDYQIRVPTHGAIQAHSEVSVTAQVAGRVLRIHPTFEVGAFFKEGEVLLELDPVDFQEAVANAKAQVAQAIFNLEMEQIRAKQARVNWDSLGYEEPPSEFVLRLPQVALAKSQLARAEEQLETAERSLKRAHVRAPFDGRVLSQSVGVGQTIGSGTSLGVIIATDYSEVRLPISTRFLGDVTLPENIDDPPIEIVLRDGLGERTGVEWMARILRTEGALDASTLELFAVARVVDPFGLQTKRDVPLRVGQPVVSEIPGRVLSGVFVIPREAMTGLDRIRLVDPDTLTLSSAEVEPLWADDATIVFNDSAIEDGTLLVLTRLVYAPDGGQVELIEDTDLAEDGFTADSGIGRRSRGSKP